MTTLTHNKITGSILDLAKAQTSFGTLRQSAIKFIEENGLPAQKAEEYKFTPIVKKLESKLSNFHLAAATSISQSDVEQAMIPGLEADVLVFDNGHFSPALSSYTQDNYTVSLFSELDEQGQSTIGQVAKIEKDPFTALNSAIFADGISIEVQKNKAVTKPIVFMHFMQANQGDIIAPRIYIHGAEGTEASFLEQIISTDDKAYFFNPVVEVKVERNAHLRYYKLQDENPEALGVNNLEADIHRDATFTTVTLSLRGDMLRNNLNLNLLDSGCEGNMYGLYLLGETTHVDNHTNVDHTMPHSESNELYKGILADKSRGVFNGKIFVRQDAQKTNAFQQNNNILLSNEAIINTKPQLEIWADDVKCSHGCTTGQLDEEALFYLQARGIGKDQAKALLLYAFAGEVMDHIKIDVLKEHFIGLVQARLEKF
ncbi:Fe-S cluster assembly protein SufD [Echinicola pacifica]|uniref:Fe-S cluster assembly protein SufD n=1 Tax=Echinicola pacifica TaxID=346377 RepID=A0A918PNB9_9BACT|nr:Fe-S cluster assembly protein SufD [Echinicola pacifica]GGZ15613.1 Fe-S cluster assembly protein SufD [Echinicola pacifica]